MQQQEVLLQDMSCNFCRQLGAILERGEMGQGCGDFGLFLGHEASIVILPFCVCGSKIMLHPDISHILPLPSWHAGVPYNPVIHAIFWAISNNSKTMVHCCLKI